MTGTDSPAYPAVKNVASTPARSSGREVRMIIVRLPRKIAPLPTPATMPAITNRARLGGEVQADATSTLSPMRAAAIPAAIRRCGGQPVVVWATAPAPKLRKIVRRPARSRVVQRSGQEHAGQAREQAEHGEAQAHAGRRGGELPARPRRHRQALRPVPGPRVKGRMALGREQDGQARQHERGEEDLEGQGEPVRVVAGEQAGDQRPARQAADIGDRGHDPSPARRGAAGPGIQVGDVGGGGGHRGAERDAGEYPRGEQPGQ